MDLPGDDNDATFGDTIVVLRLRLRRDVSAVMPRCAYSQNAALSVAPTGASPRLVPVPTSIGEC